MAWCFEGQYNGLPALFLDIKFSENIHAEDSVCKFLLYFPNGDGQYSASADLQNEFLQQNFVSGNVIKTNRVSFEILSHVTELGDISFVVSGIKRQNAQKANV